MGLGKDLAQIREQLGVELEELQGLSKLSMELLEEIESDRIFSSEVYNSAYRRNFIRSYARALKIKEAVIVKALDDVESGKYDHNIFKEAGAPNPKNPFGNANKKTSTIEETPKAPPIKTELNYDEKTRVEALKSSAESEKTEGHETQETDSTQEELSSVTEDSDKNKKNKVFKSKPDSEKKEETTSHNEVSNTENTNSDDDSPTESTTSVKSSTTSRSKENGDSNSSNNVAKRESTVAAKKKIDDVNWAQMGKRFNEQQAQKSNVLLISIIAIVVVSVLTFGFLYRSTIGDWMTSFSDSETTESNEFTNTPALDSLANTNIEDGSELVVVSQDSVAINSANTNQANESESSSRDNQASISTQVTATISNPSATETDENLQADATEVLSNTQEQLDSDTLSIVVYAAFDKLEPVRITSDLRNSTYPYWIEQGQAYSFDFRDEILIRGQFSRMLLIFNNTVIEDALERFYDGVDNTIRITRSDLSTDEFQSNMELVLPDGVRAPQSIEDGFNE